MENGKFLVFRYVVIILTCLGLISIEIYKYRNTPVLLEENDAVKAAKEYVSSNNSYFNELFKEKDMEYRIDTNTLINNKLLKKKSEFKGYVNIINNAYSFVEEPELLIDKIMDNNSLTKNDINEGMPYDLNYYYKGDDPKNYIKYNRSRSR